MLGPSPKRAHSPSPSDSTLPAPSVAQTGRNSFMAYGQQHSNHFHFHGAALSLDAGSTPINLLSTFFNAILATALFRCWHILVFYIGWATMVTLVNESGTSLTFQATLLTVVGTVLGFVISYRTTSSFERYNEGRRYWSQIILASRTLARAVWFHIPELPPATSEDEKEGRTEDERRARNLIEKKTVINLIEAFSVAVKHYLRGEEGIAYVDLYHLVKFLPSYSFPTGVIPSTAEAQANNARTQSYREAAGIAESIRGGDDERMSGMGVVVEEEEAGDEDDEDEGRVSVEPASPPHVTLGLPLPVTTPGPLPTQRSRGLSVRSSLSLSSHRRTRSFSHSSQRTTRPFQAPPPVPALPQRSVFLSSADLPADQLLPASLPPKHSVFDVFPFSLFVRLLTSKGRTVEGKKAAKMRAKNVIVTRNVPLEISMYLTSYVSTLGARKAIDVPTNNLLILSVNQLTDALTGLERILTTPIPFSYSIHLWLVTIIYNLALPFQIYPTLRWLTIPAAGVMSFIFFGFLVAGEEIENPFGYDKNDLNMDHFTHNIIRNELRALTAFPPPPPEQWAFSPRNDRLFAGSDGFATSSSNVAHGLGEKDASVVGFAHPHGGVNGHGGIGTGLTPEEWVRRGPAAMKDALARAH